MDCKLFRCQFKFHESTLFALSILWGVCWLYSWHDTCHGLVAGASSTRKEAHCDVWQVQDISRDSLDKGVYVWNMPLDCDETLPLSLVYSTQFPSEWEHKSRQEQSYSSKYLKDQNIKRIENHWNILSKYWNTYWWFVTYSSKSSPLEAWIKDAPRGITSRWEDSHDELRLGGLFFFWGLTILL